MGKNIIICSDGTGRDIEPPPSNVLRIVELLNHEDQTVCYDSGVGTFNLLGKPRKDSLGALLSRMFGYGLKLNIIHFYIFLMTHFEPDDRIFLFGFSRGAYTMRALAGMLHKCGLLEEGCHNLLPHLSKVYHKPNNIQQAAYFKKTFGRTCKPHFIGVYDTVRSLGYFFGKTFFDAKLNPDIKHAYHAVAIDEERKKFNVCLWNEKLKHPDQNIEQVWFPGVHTDIGGGYPERSLSDITLNWLLNKAETCGALLQQNWQQQLHPNPQGTIHHSRQGVWRLWQKKTRKIPGDALIHRSVSQRMEHVRDYRPTLPQQYTIVD